MSPKTDSGSLKLNWNSLFQQALPLLDGVVRTACLRYQHYPTDEDIERFSQRMILLLLEDDCRRLRSFEQRSSFHTWLQTLANHYVSRFLRRERRQMALDELPADFSFQAPTQDDEIWEMEKMKLLDKATKRLTKRERQLLALLRQDEVSSADIAQKMGIKTESVYRAKNELITKLQRLLGMIGGGGNFFHSRFSFLLALLIRVRDLTKR